MVLSHDDLLSRVREAYKHEPEKFKKWFPDLVDLVALERRPSLKTFGLTERERGERIKHLRECLAKKPWTREIAIEALQHHAVLADDRWGMEDVTSTKVSRLVGLVIGKPLADVGGPSEFEVRSGPPSSREVAVLAGVRLRMTWDYTLVSIKVDPAHRKAASRFLALVGRGNDPKADVSTRHDDYLTEEEPHAHS